MISFSSPLICLYGTSSSQFDIFVRTVLSILRWDSFRWALVAQQVHCEKGSGESILTGDNSFTGGTSIVDGELIVDDPIEMRCSGPIEFSNIQVLEHGMA